MAIERPLAQRRQLASQLPPRRHRERGGHADVMKPLPLLVVQPQEQRADQLPGPALCHRNPATTQSAVRTCLTLIIARLPG